MDDYKKSKACTICKEMYLGGSGSKYCERCKNQRRLEDKKRAYYKKK